MPRPWVLTPLAPLLLLGWWPLSPAAPRVGEVDIEDDHFTPPEMTIRVEGEVVWTHRGNDRHTVTADDGSFDSRVLGRRTQFQRTFHTPGRYPYHCRFHGESDGEGMSGVVVVRSHTSVLPRPLPPPVTDVVLLTNALDSHRFRG